MLAVWASLVEVIEFRNDRPRPIVMPDERWVEELLKDCPAVVRERVKQYDHPLSAVSEIARSDLVGTIQPEELGEEVNQWLLKASRDRDLNHLIDRARGQTWRGIGVRWCRASRRFMDKPWDLPLVERTHKPQYLRSIQCPVDAMRIALLKALHRSGSISVKERFLDEGRARDRIRRSCDPKWQCTLQAAVKGNICLEVWETFLDRDRLHVRTTEGFREYTHQEDWEGVVAMGWTDAKLGKIPI